MDAHSTLYPWAALNNVDSSVHTMQPLPNGITFLLLGKMSPFHAERSFLFYLLRNVALALLSAVFTICLAIGKWFSDPTTGFTLGVSSRGNSIRD